MLRLAFIINLLNAFLLKFYGGSAELIWMSDTNKCSPPIPSLGSILTCKRSIAELECSIKCEKGAGKIVCNFETGKWTTDNSSFVCNGDVSFDRKTVDQKSNFSENECRQLLAILHGKILCFKYTERIKCIARCSPNYAFPNGDNLMNIQCSKGMWTPVDTIPECVSKLPNSSPIKMPFVDLCPRPSMPIPGEMQCVQKHGSNQCTARCLSNHKFSDGRLALSTTCLFSVGIWIPFRNFPNCIEPTFKETSGCYLPQATAHGETLCVYKRDTVSCFGKCQKGFAFPSKGNRSRIKCNKKRGKWLPSEESLTCSNPGLSLDEEKCCVPRVIVPGRVSCYSSSSYSLICNATCNKGYQFADGRIYQTLTCDEMRSKFVPYDEFSTCIPI